MKTIEPNFKAGGFNHQQLVRKGDVAIYKRWKDGMSPHWEVVKIGSHNGYAIAGVVIPPAETYPNSEQWGSRGFTFTTQADAEAKFNKLTSAQ